MKAATTVRTMCKVMSVALLSLAGACGQPMDEEDFPEPVAAEDVSASTSALTSSELETLRQQMLLEVNKARAVRRTCGTTSYPAVPPLKRDPRLDTASQGHSADMAAKNYFSHTSLDGRSPFDRMADAGYDYRAAAENIAAGNPDVARTMTQWLNSPGHCKNIMSGKYVHIGIGFATNSSARYRHYWTQNFGAPL
jgi:uncharacterized protein YkwD